jgi:hypothetical protein
LASSSSSSWPAPSCTLPDKRTGQLAHRAAQVGTGQLAHRAAPGSWHPTTRSSSSRWSATPRQQAHPDPRPFPWPTISKGWWGWWAGF